MFLYPQVDRGHARLLAQDYASRAIGDVRARCADLGIQKDQCRYTAVGASRVLGLRLEDLRDGLRELAATLGYPDKRLRANQRSFDFEAARFLWEEMKIVPGEASRNGVWQYMCCVLVPDIVCWRFGKSERQGGVAPPVDDINRFLGGPRNALGRLWWRAYVLRDEEYEAPFELLDPNGAGLTEDNFVQVLERPRVGGNAAFCRQLLKEFLARREEVSGVGGNAAQRLLREVMKRIVRRSSFVSFGALSHAQCAALIEDIFGETLPILTATAESAPYHPR